jgi:PAS domain S-box-containing protein
LTGRRSSEAAGRPLTEVFPIINEQTRQPVENPVDKVLRLGTVVGLANHTLLLRKDGVEIPIDDSAAPIRVAGGPLLGVVLVFRDFTEHRKAQQTSARLAAIVEFSGDAILTKNLDGAIQTWNAGAERLFGYRAEEIIGRPVTVLIPPDRLAEEEQIIGRLRRGLPSERMDTIRISKDGRPIPVLVTASPLKDSEDNVIGASKIIRDITERKQMEDALRAREAELEAIINRTPFMLTRCSRDLRYTFASQAYAAMIGRSPGEVAGKPIVEIMGEEGFTTIRPHVEKVLQGRRVEYESEVHFHGIGTRFLHVVYTPVTNRLEEVTGWVASILDITERKRAEQALRESQERLVRLISSAMDAVIAVDAQQKITLFNPAAEQMFCCPAGEAIGGSLERFIPHRYREAHRDHIEKFGQTGVTSRRMGSLMTLTGLRMNGEEFPIEASISQVEVGALKTFKVILRDITERKQAERRLSVSHSVTHILAESSAISGAIPNVLQAIGEGLGWDVGDMWTLDSEAGVLRCHNVWHAPSVAIESFKAISFATAFLPGSSLPGRVWATLKPVCISDVDKDTNFVRAPEALALGLHPAFAFPIVAGEKFLGVMEFFSAGHREADDALMQMFTGIGSQIGQFMERKRAEDALHQAQRALASRAVHLEALVEQRTARLNETIGDLETFSYSIVHDLRAPLRAMNNFARLLADECGPISSTARDYVDRITTAAERMDRLIQDVLNYSRVARTELPLQSLDLGVLLRGIVATYPGFQPPHAAVELAGDFPMVLANEAALTQCISNLIGNAVKFVEPGVLSRVRVWAEAAGHHVRLCFEDNGIGIEKSTHEKIFQMFQRLSKRYEGTGIGLTIVKKAIEKMGGHVGLESTPGKGSTFWLELPRPTPNSQAIAPGRHGDGQTVKP